MVSRGGVPCCAQVHNVYAARLGKSILGAFKPGIMAGLPASQHMFALYCIPVFVFFRSVAHFER